MLSVGLAAVVAAFAVAFAVIAAMSPSRAATEMLHVDRERKRLGRDILNRAVPATVLILAYMGVVGVFSHLGVVVALFGTVSTMALSWVVCSIVDVFERSAAITSGAEDEHPGFGGLWESRDTGRELAEAILENSPAGWFTPGHPNEVQVDSPVFIAKELALQYGAARSAAYLYYTQICDLDEPAGVAERIARIESCLKEMDRLQALEQRMRSLLPEQPELLEWLT